MFLARARNIRLATNPASDTPATTGINRPEVILLSAMATTAMMSLTTLMI
jgi:hypothetical protein